MPETIAAAEKRIGIPLRLIFHLAFFALSCAPVSAYNPLIYQQYTADPTAFWIPPAIRLYHRCTPWTITGQTGYIR